MKQRRFLCLMIFLLFLYGNTTVVKASEKDATVDTDIEENISGSVEQDGEKEDNGEDEKEDRVTITAVGKGDDFVSIFDGELDMNNERVIQAVDSGAQVNTETISQPYNIIDILSYTAILFVAVSITVFWIMHTIKERKDPLRKYMK